MYFQNKILILESKTWNNFQSEGASQPAVPDVVCDADLAPASLMIAILDIR